MTAHADYTNHFLPADGGTSAQPNKVMEAIRYLQHLHNKSDEESSKKSQKDRKPYGLKDGRGTSSGTSAPKQSFKKGRAAPRPKSRPSTKSVPRKR